MSGIPSPMAEHLHSDKTPQITVTPPSTPMSSMPLQLSGFLSGDTIQVEGEAGNLQFSIQFNIRNKSLSMNDSSKFNFPPSLNTLDNNISCEDSSFSSHMTSRSTQEIENENQIADSEPLMLQHRGIEMERNQKPDMDRTKPRDTMTRLRSGAISKVKYSPRSSRKECSSFMSLTMKRKSKKRRNGVIVLEKFLQRRSLPVRPCSSYVFFVMASWGSLKSSSFGEGSKRLSQIWCKLPRKEKKIYEEMALRDSARYKRQCMLLNCKDQYPPPDQNSGMDENSAN